MTTSFIKSKSLALSLLAGGLVLVGVSAAGPLQEHDHGAHGHEGEQSATKQEWAGDPYLLGTDAVSGKALGPVGEQVIIKHEGRELRFAGAQTAAAFQAEPAKYLAAVDKRMIEQQLAFYPLETCVISGEKLGGEMGEAINVLYKNRLVSLCCKGCKKDLAKDPAGVIAKLDTAVIAAQKSAYPLTTCPVSGEELGGMGDPIEYVMGNRLVMLCCKGCKKKITKDPVATLAKLDAAGAGGGTHAADGHGGGHGDGGGHDHGDHGHNDG